MDATKAIDMLKEIYGCGVFLLGAWPSKPSRERFRMSRRSCEAKLLAARKRHDTLAVGIHKDHLVMHDIFLMRG